MIDFGLSGRVAVVTGANHGIGAATAEALAALDVRVVLSYLRIGTASAPDDAPPGPEHYARQRGRSADEVVERIRQRGGLAVAIEADLAAVATPPALFDFAEAHFGPVEILVNNAAHWEPDSFAPSAPEPGVWSVANLLTAESADQTFAVNARAPALLTAELARRHAEGGRRWGRVINVSSDGADGAPNEVSYWASKAALESYTRSSASELGQFGITVNCVSPGPIQTGYISPQLEARLIPTIPLGRLGEPADIADAIVLLASEQARWLTGQIVYVGGGHRM